jgi:hypothetical protein
MSRDKLDTGTGGFSVTVKNSTNRYTFDTGSTVGDEPPIPWSPGDINVDHENKDVSKGTKRTLASYLSKTTLGQTPSSPTSVSNKYPVAHNENEDPNSATLSDERGFPQPLSPSINDQPHFADVQPGDSRSSAAANLNMLRGRQPVEIGVLVPRDGNTLLKDLELETAADKPYKKLSDLDPVGVYSRSLLNNRFTSDNSYPTKPETSQIRDAQYAYKYPMGKSLPKEAPERNISYARLAQIGNALSIRAGLELKSLDQGNNPTDNASQAGAILPGSTQLGVYRLEREQLEAASVLESLTTEGIDDNLLINPAKQSWGTLNNVLDQYAGISNFGMQLLAVALIVALSLVVTLISQILPGIDLSPSVSPMDNNGIRPFGRSYGKKSNRLDYSSLASIVSQGSDFDFWGLLGFPPTMHPLSKCLGAGVLLFFGIAPPDNASFGIGNLSGIAAVEGPKSAMKNPGYYTIMARSINRSFLLISDSLLSLGKSFASGNFVTGMQQTLEFVNVFRESKFMGSLKVFSRLGDAYLYDAKDPKLTPDGRHLSRIDDQPNSNVLKGRFSLKDTIFTKLTWSASTAENLLLYPKGLQKVYSNASKKLDAPPINGQVGKDGKDRIDDDTRIDMEKRLDSEYVPFYFHDVRTNEILNFHAFLASLSDDYSATYDSSEGFGRVEPIKTYKGTQRKIGFSFYVASTSQDDVNAMWEKINKLVTLVYPQYTEGRRLTSPDKKYDIHMPFSQTIQASPLVRLRIGDLIRSNYSRFNLARLFGYTYNDTKFNNVKNPSVIEGGIIPEEVAEKKAKAAAFTAGNIFIPEYPWQLKDYIKDSAFTIEDAKAEIDKVALETALALKLKSVGEGEGEGAKDEYEVVADPDADAGSYAKMDQSTAANMDLVLSLPRSHVRYSRSTRKVYELAKAEAAEDDDAANVKNSKYTDEVDNFMKEEENSVVKSFKSSGGKGLAGFIESMSFDWYDRVTWETAGNSGKAPKMCKVTISFSPVHDISPGLDHEGGNRAPVYPVGGFFRK